MKRKVFSLMMLCLFAFLGMANAQQSGTINVTPDPIDLGYRPLGAWTRPFEVQFTTTSTTAQTITAIEADNAFFVLNANLPGTVSSTTPYNFTVVQGEGEAGGDNGRRRDHRRREEGLRGDKGQAPGDEHRHRQPHPLGGRSGAHRENQIAYC